MAKRSSKKEPKDITLAPEFDTVVRHGTTSVEFGADGSLNIYTYGKVSVYSTSQINAYAPTADGGLMKFSIQPPRPAR